MESFWAFICGLFMGVFLVCISLPDKDKEWQDKIIKAGVGEWQVDKVSGKTKFIIFEIKDIKKQEK